MADGDKGRILQYPVKEIIDAERYKNSSWLVLSPKKAVTINFTSRDMSIQTQDDREKDTFKFLLPMSITTPLQHRWDDQSTVSGKLRDAVVGLIRESGLMVGEYQNIKNAAANVDKIDVASARKFLGKVAQGGETNVSKFAMKNDNPVVYSNSSRRSLSIELNLAVYKSAYDDVFYPIKKLMEYSSPSALKDSVIDYQYPTIFDLKVKHGDKLTLLSIDNAVITSINPTMNGPYINGYPSSAELTLQFEDIDPLYVKSLQTGSEVITVKTKQRTP